MASPMLLGVYNETVLSKCAHWYVSEKYDGWRMTYKNGVFVSRQGNVLDVPKAMQEEVMAFGDVVLDGELWFGYGAFNQIAGALLEGNEELKFMIFDIPSHPGNFQERYEKMRELFLHNTDTKTVHLIEQTRVSKNDLKNIDDMYSAILAKSGEGAVIKPYDMPYIYGKRHEKFMKRKPWDSMDVKIVGYHTTDAKKNAGNGYVSSLVCENDGKKFKVSVKSFTPPAIGSSVTIQYTQTTCTGLPKFPYLLSKENRIVVDLKRATKLDKVVPPKSFTDKKTIEDWTLLGGYELRNGERVKVISDNNPNVEYVVARAQKGTSVYCECPSWKFQRVNPVCRTCKHCEAVCGARNEAIRVARANLYLLERN